MASVGLLNTTPRLAMPAQRNLPRLTSLRGFAALMVFVFHLQTLDVVDVPLPRLVDLGYTGVAFFFVLSGFVLAWTYEPGQVRRFYTRRFARIYPAHLLLVLVAAVVPIVDVSRSWHALAPSLLLVQSFSTTKYVYFAFNSVSWTLSCEAFFYLLFPVAFVLLARARRRWRLGVGLVGIFIVVATMYVRPGLTALWFHWPPARFAEFLLGVALACEIRAGTRLPRLSLWWAVPLLVAGMLLVSSFISTPFLANPLLALPYAGIIVAAAQADVAGRGGSLLTRRPFIYAGEVSFAFYLVHVIVIHNIQPYVTGPGWLRSLAMFAASVAAAVLVHHFVELPAQRLITGRLKQRRSLPAPAPVATH